MILYKKAADLAKAINDHGRKNGIPAKRKPKK